MFRNTLTGLSKRQKEVMDKVCIHLNGCMTRMGLRDLHGEEDSILIDLWMDSFPYKTDENGNVVTKVVRETTYDVVDGKYTKVVKEKVVKELDYSRSLMESTSIGIYKWRGEQLLINKVKYLFGDKRVRVKEADANGVMHNKVRVEYDAWGNARVRAVYEEDVDYSKSSKRDYSKNINESDLSRDGEDSVSIADVAGVVDNTFEEYIFMDALERVCDDLELDICKKLLAGYSKNQVYKECESKGIKFTVNMMEKLKAKLLPILKPEMVN